MASARHRAAGGEGGRRPAAGPDDFVGAIAPGRVFPSLLPPARFPAGNFFKPMKTKLNRDEWRVTSDQGNVASHARQSAVLSANRKLEMAKQRAFTLIEMLTVIAIIAILAALLLPALAAAKIEAQKKQARIQIQDLVQQIQNYESAYSRMPIPAFEQQAAEDSAQHAAGMAGNFTYGGWFKKPDNSYYQIGTPVPAAANSIFCNSNVIAILMDITNYPDGSGPTVNDGHVKNPQRTAFLNAKMVDSTNLPGVGPDLVYRDPWDDPYIITLDLNDDNQCLDSFYSLQNVSQTRPSPSSPPGNYNTQAGYNGLINNTDQTGNGSHFAYHGSVMVWSAGPDKKVDPNAPANSGANKDNIISWQ